MELIDQAWACWTFEHNACIVIGHGRSPD